MCMCVGQRERRKGEFCQGLTLKNGGLHTSLFMGDREKEAGTKQEVQSCLNKTQHIYAIPSTRSFITNYFDCTERKALSKNYLLWVYYEKGRLTP